MQALVTELSHIARLAGAAILEVYEQQDHGVETKDDDSPLTAADLASHRLIVGELTRLYPDIPVLSEESTAISWEERSTWNQYFLIDPLDGTKEFISRNGEFTVNIALIEQGDPTAGVVFVPVKNILYAGFQGDVPTAYVERERSVTPIKTRAVSGDKLTIVASRRHGGDALAGVMAVLEQEFTVVETLNMGSSLKLCLVAEGYADFYPRLAPTSEWDTAAAHAVVLAAGGKVVDTRFEPLRYNTKADLLNPFFYVIGDPAWPWESVLAKVRPG
ncbi:MAG: 3'(2'),5'-bisphosphate nucleotidase CysQ [Pseudomonadales bacterium]